MRQIDLSDVRGQATAKRALEVSAAGGHSLLLIGPPGSGKTMLARRMNTILPPMAPDQVEAVTEVSRKARLIAEDDEATVRPFRAPHYTASKAGLIGFGGAIGEVALATAGVLLLDELPEFSRPSLIMIGERLRQQGPLTRPILIGSMAQCPCGNYGNTQRECSCSVGMVKRYQARVILPFAMRVGCPSVPMRELTRKAHGETSVAVQARVIAARARQDARNALNAFVDAPLDSPAFVLDDDGVRLLTTAGERYALSAAEIMDVLRVARTIADLENSENIRAVHLSEAVQYHSPQV